VLPHDWSPGEFAELHLADFAAKCRAWRDGYEAAGRSGRGIRRPHDPGPDSADHTRPEPGPLSMVISTPLLGSGQGPGPRPCPWPGAHTSSRASGYPAGRPSGALLLTPANGGPAPSTSRPSEPTRPPA